MKKTFSAKPEAMDEQWMIQSGGFSWMDFVLGMPHPVFLVTGWKSNGKQNASLQSWSTFVGGGLNDFVCIMGRVNRGGHLYRSLKETGVCVLNFPANDVYDRCVKTIGGNGFDTDEIAAAGLTAEPAERVNAPRVAECFLHIECEFLWEHPLFPGSQDMTVAVKAVCIHMESDRFGEGGLRRYGNTGYLFQIDQPTHPETGAITSFGPGIIVQGDPVAAETDGAESARR